MLQPWHWLVLGICVLIIELFGMQGFLLGIAAAAFVLAASTYVVSISVVVQCVSFAFLSVILTYAYWYKFRRFNNRSDRPLLNERSHRLIGRQVTLIQGIEQGLGKVQIGDTLWTVSAHVPMPVGTVVEIIDVDGMTLQVVEVKSTS